MSTMITRKRFLISLFGSTAAVLLEGCGGGGDGYSSPTPSPSPSPPAAGCDATAISGNHGHALEFPKTDLDSMADKNYNIMGTADHNHSVTLTVAQLATLKAGGSVTVTSSTTSGHSHDVTVGCT